MNLGLWGNPDFLQPRRRAPDAHVLACFSDANGGDRLAEGERPLLMSGAGFFSRWGHLVHYGVLSSVLGLHLWCQ